MKWYAVNGRSFWRFRFAIHSFCRRYANINFGQYQLEGKLPVNYGRRNYRSKNHILFALSYAAVSSSTIENNELTETKQVQCYNPLPDRIEELHWEKVVQDENVCVYRRWITSLGVYEYSEFISCHWKFYDFIKFFPKPTQILLFIFTFSILGCAGTYRDISAKNFMQAQMDVDYRKEWDSHVLHLNVNDLVFYFKLQINF